MVVGHEMAKLEAQRLELVDEARYSSEVVDDVVSLIWFLSGFEK